MIILSDYFYKVRLEKEVFAKMHEVIKTELQNSDQSAVTDVQFVSFEEALKELAQMNK